MIRVVGDRGRNGGGRGHCLYVLVVILCLPGMLYVFRASGRVNFKAGSNLSCRPDRGGARPTNDSDLL